MTIPFTTSRFPSFSISPFMKPLARTRARWPFSSMERGRMKFFFLGANSSRTPCSIPALRITGMPIAGSNLLVLNTANDFVVAGTWMETGATLSSAADSSQNSSGSIRPNLFRRCSVLSAWSAAILRRFPNTIHCLNA